MNHHHFDSLLGPARGVPSGNLDVGLRTFDIEIRARGLWVPYVTEDEVQRRLPDVRRLAALPGLRPTRLSAVSRPGERPVAASPVWRRALCAHGGEGLGTVVAWTAQPRVCLRRTCAD